MSEQPECKNCDSLGWVCENHPDVSWGEGDECCGGAGMPCSECNQCDEHTMPRELAGSTPIWSLKDGFYH